MRNSVLTNIGMVVGVVAVTHFVVGMVIHFSNPKPELGWLFDIGESIIAVGHALFVLRCALRRTWFWADVTSMVPEVLGCAGVDLDKRPVRSGFYGAV